jgi:hypothetical protein
VHPVLSCSIQRETFSRPYLLLPINVVLVSDFLIFQQTQSDHRRFYFVVELFKNVLMQGLMLSMCRSNPLLQSVMIASCGLAPAEFVHDDWLSDSPPRL